jgi:hypothetical protein
MRHQMDALKEMKGEPFDAQFMRAMADGHEEVILDLTTVRDRIVVMPVRELVRKTIPILEQHHTVALRLLSDRPWQKTES